MATSHRAVDEAPTRVRHRKSVDKLSNAQLGALRDAVASMAAIRNTDERSYQYFASLHGGPPRAYCHHGSLDARSRFHGAPLFLPWHRAYLYFLELAMQDRVPEATLAWWDWTSPLSHSRGIPQAYARARVGGKANPLYRQPIQPAAPRPPGVPRQTQRDKNPPSALPTPETLERILNRSQFYDFSTGLEGELHNAVHGWVGGSMGQVPIAAYDPVFYAHHTMVDRIWYLWQLRHGQPGPPASAMNVVLEPFPMTVGDVLDITNLGYEYAGSTAHAPGTT